MQFNTDAWIYCVDEAGEKRKFRFVYYNNKLHDPKGTRNEYRITYMTKYFREMRARENDTFEISRTAGRSEYSIRVVRSPDIFVEHGCGEVVRIKLTKTWRRVH